MSINVASIFFDTWFGHRSIELVRPMLVELKKWVRVRAVETRFVTPATRADYDARDREILDELADAGARVTFGGGLEALAEHRAGAHVLGIDFAEVLLRSPADVAALDRFARETLAGVMVSFGTDALSDESRLVLSHLLNVTDTVVRIARPCPTCGGNAPIDALEQRCRRCMHSTRMLH